MSHLTAEEKHDAAYGFRTDRHCDGCVRDIAALSRERDALRRIFGTAAVAPVRRARPWWLLVPAAALVVAMVRLLAVSEAPAKPRTVPAQDTDTFLARCVRDLTSPSAARREMAARALKAHGRLALPVLDAAKTPQARSVAAEIRVPDAATRAVLASMAETDVTVNYVDQELLRSVADLRQLTQLNFVVDTRAIPKPDDVKLTLKATSKLVRLLEDLLSPSGLAAYVQDGVIVITKAGQVPDISLPARAPLRVPVRAPADLDRWIADLGSDSPEARDRASRALHEHALAAEPRLWDALDAKDAEAVTRAADLLRRMYALPEVPKRGPIVWKTAELNTRVSYRGDKVRVADVVEFIAEDAGFSFVTDGELAQHEITLAVRDLQAGTVLKLALSQSGKDCVELDGYVYAGAPQRIVRTPPAEGPLVWLEAAAATELSRGLVRAAAGDAQAAASLKLMGAQAVPRIRHVARTMEGREKLEAIADAIVEERVADCWFVDEPTPLERAGAHREALSKKVRLELKNGTLGEACTKLATQTGLSIEAADPSLALSVRLVDLPLATVLRALAGPRGLRVELNGAKIVLR